EAQRPARRLGARARDGRRRRAHRPAARPVPGRAHRRAGLPRRGTRRSARALKDEAAARAPGARIVSPNEADAELAVSFLRENGIEAQAGASLVQVAATLDEACGCLVI